MAITLVALFPFLGPGALGESCNVTALNTTQDCEYGCCGEDEADVCCTSIALIVGGAAGAVVAVLCLCNILRGRNNKAQVESTPENTQEQPTNAAPDTIAYSASPVPGTDTGPPEGTGSRAGTTVDTSRPESGPPPYQTPLTPGDACPAPPYSLIPYPAHYPPPYSQEAPAENPPGPPPSYESLFRD